MNKYKEKAVKLQEKATLLQNEVKSSLKKNYIFYGKKLILNTLLPIGDLMRQIIILEGKNPDYVAPAPPVVPTIDPDSMYARYPRPRTSFDHYLPSWLRPSFKNNSKHFLYGLDAKKKIAEQQAELQTEEKLLENSAQAAVLVDDNYYEVDEEPDFHKDPNPTTLREDTFNEVRKGFGFDGLIQESKDQTIQVDVQSGTRPIHIKSSFDSSVSRNLSDIVKAKNEKKSFAKVRKNSDLDYDEAFDVISKAGISTKTKAELVEALVILKKYAEKINGD